MVEEGARRAVAAASGGRMRWVGWGSARSVPRDGVAPRGRERHRSDTRRGIVSGVEEQRSWGRRFRKRLEKDESRAARGPIRGTDPCNSWRFAEGDGGSARWRDADVERWQRQV